MAHTREERILGPRRLLQSPRLGRELRGEFFQILSNHPLDLHHLLEFERGIVRGKIVPMEVAAMPFNPTHYFRG